MIATDLDENIVPLRPVVSDGFWVPRVCDAKLNGVSYFPWFPMAWQGSRSCIDAYGSFYQCPEAVVSRKTDRISLFSKLVCSYDADVSYAYATIAPSDYGYERSYRSDRASQNKINFQRSTFGVNGGRLSSWTDFDNYYNTSYTEYTSGWSSSGTYPVLSGSFFILIAVQHFIEVVDSYVRTEYNSSSGTKYRINGSSQKITTISEPYYGDFDIVLVKGKKKDISFTSAKGLNAKFGSPVVRLKLQNGVDYYDIASYIFVLGWAVSSEIVNANY